MPVRLIIPPIPPNFETVLEAEQRSAQLGRLLNKTANPTAQALAERLITCRRSQRCLSAACPSCNREFRLRFYREALIAIPANVEILAVSMIPKEGRIEVGSLSSVRLKTWVASRRRGLARALPAGTLFVGGVDISLNTFENRDHHWCLHVFGFVILPFGWGVEQRYRLRVLRRRIEQHCSPIPTAERSEGEVPLRVGPRSRSHFEATLLYGYKSEFYRRSRYCYTKRIASKRSTNTGSQSLPSAHRAELAMFLDQFPLGSRLILVGLRRRGHFVNFKLFRDDQ